MVVDENLQRAFATIAHGAEMLAERRYLPGAAIPARNR